MTAETMLQARIGKSDEWFSKKKVKNLHFLSFWEKGQFWTVFGQNYENN